MFDLITGKAVHIPRNPATPILISTAMQLTALGVIAAVSFVVVTDNVPEIRTMMAFVAAAPAPAPPPPPPAPAPPPAQRAATAPRPVPTTGTFVAPTEAPREIVPDAPGEAFDEGVAGGVEGGVPGGVVGGIVGGLPGEVPAPPPLAPAPEPPQGPVRVGGNLKAPELLYRVEPVYPSFALAANVQGTVILEATVDEEGRVQDVRVLRGQPLLDKAALQAVRQWRYSPVLLNGRPARFILTVVLSFNLESK